MKVSKCLKLPEKACRLLRLAARAAQDRGEKGGESAIVARLILENLAIR